MGYLSDLSDLSDLNHLPPCNLSRPESPSCHGRPPQQPRGTWVYHLLLGTPRSPGLPGSPDVSFQLHLIQQVDINY